MSARIPSRRLGQSGLAALCPRPALYISPTVPTRTFSNTHRHNAEKTPTTTKPNPSTPTTKVKVAKIDKPKTYDRLGNPILEAYLTKHKPGETVPRPEPRLGDLSKHANSLFGTKPSGPHAAARAEESQKTRERDLHGLTLDPAPRARLRLEKRLAIRDVLRNGRVTKEIKLARTEREYIYHSPALSTSMKKLTRLMHLIAGKTIEEALIQLRFSPKRVARDVMKFLMVGRDEAVTQRGMGIGGAQAAREAFQRELENMSAKKGVEWTPYLADGTRRLERKPEEGRLIEMKDGSQKRIYDETEIYISQAWVTKGQHSKSIEQRARGQVNVLKHQTTSFSVMLKEEKTRMRLSDEIQKKRDNRKLWVPLPDRPVTSQRQYCLW